MRTDLRSSILWIGPDQLLELRDARGRVLTSVIGTLWVTQQDDPRDIVITAGDSRRIERDGITLAQSLNGAAYVLVEDGVAARLINADGSSEAVTPARLATASDIARRAVAGDATSLHEWARHERSRAIAMLFADATDAMLDLLRRAGRRLAAITPSAAAALAR